MSRQKTTVALLPGTFDPITNGHVDIIRRAADLFDELVVAVGDNPGKESLLSKPQRCQIVGEVVAGLANVRVESYSGLTAHFARQIGARVLLRGIRNSSDLRFEVQLAQTNRSVTGIETVFVLPAPEVAFISSTLIRQVAREGGDVASLVPPEVLPYLADKKKRRQGRGA